VCVEKACVKGGVVDIMTKRKYLRIVLVCFIMPIMVLAVISLSEKAIPAYSGYEQKYDILEYMTVNSDGLIIEWNAAPGVISDLWIPVGKDGVIITGIADRVFANRSFRSLTFEEGSQITSLGKAAFKNNPIQGVLELPDMLESIGDQAFRNTRIEEVIFPDSLTDIGAGAFQDCRYLISADLSNTKLTEIIYQTFANCHSLEAVTFPKNLAEIHMSTFFHCCCLQVIDLSKTSITRIGKSAFYKCTNLTDVKFPESLAVIEQRAFLECNSLKIVDLSNTQLTTVAANAFLFNNHSIDILLPETLTTILN